MTATVLMIIDYVLMIIFQQQIGVDTSFFNQIYINTKRH